jgi:solute carrier family 15 (peptide/histidine transporter), member 3/4
MNRQIGYVFIVSLVPVFTVGGGSPRWIPDNLNEGHLDRFYE